MKTLEHSRVDATDRLRRRFRSYALVSGIGTYLLIVFGGIVRITGSGLGCGDDWPLCNGQLLPPWDLATWIEWTHRLLAAGLALPIVATAVYGVRRRLAGDPAPGSVAAVAAVVLLIVQVALGAITVKLELPPVVTALHFVNAMLMLGALISAAVAAGGEPGLIEDGAAGRKRVRVAMGALVLGLLTVTLGALTANLGLVGATTQPSAAAWACQGFPLCNGEFMPKSGGSGLVHTHWTHRVLAYLLFFHVIGAAIALIRGGAPTAVRNPALASAVLVVAQVAVAAGLVLLGLPSSYRVLHLAVGVALWAAIVNWYAAAKRVAARGA